MAVGVTLVMEEEVDPVEVTLAPVSALHRRQHPRQHNLQLQA